MLSLKGLKFISYRFILFSIFFFFLLNAFLSLDLTERFEFGNDTPLKADKKNVQDVGESISGSNELNTSLIAELSIQSFLDKVKSLEIYYKASYILYLESLLPKNIRSAENVDLWQVAANWVSVEQVIPNFAPLVPSVLESLRVSRITKADVARKGTQLKLFLELENKQVALFKPKWYTIDEKIEGSVYAGKDRYNGEIVAFHIARLLSLNRVPLVTERTLDLLTEIIPFATPALNGTFLKKGSNICFYGECYHCSISDPICADRNRLDGSIVLWLPEFLGKLVKRRHPWQRTYNSKHAQWEKNPYYCDKVKLILGEDSQKLLLDLIETSVFDFLIDNGDRHHYEVFNSPMAKVLLIDNGKSFGNPAVDHLDILAPLYQCCMIRLSFVHSLASLKRDSLSRWLKRILNKLNLDHLLSIAHYPALDRRLDKVLAAILMCLSKYDKKEVIL